MTALCRKELAEFGGGGFSDSSLSTTGC